MAFVTEAALIALREGLEALLVTGILLSLVTRMGRPEARKHVWAGFAAAVLVSVVAGWGIQEYLLVEFEQQGWGAWFALAAILLAVATLTYMVFWMWGHTSQVLGKAKAEVEEALTAGSLATIVAITFLSVIREGLETVLFYSALTTEHAFSDIVVSGAAGFALSAGLVYAVLRASQHVNLKRFFQLTGAWLLVIAAMLLTHAVEALTQLGYLAPQPAIWDTSWLLAADSVAGRILHATVGYMPAPTLYQAVAYLGYLTVAGGAFLLQQGFFTTATTDGDEPLPRRIAAVALALALAFSTVGVAAQDPVEGLGTSAAGHDHGPDVGEHDHEPRTAEDLPANTTLGVMLRSHGEPIEYNATTYQSFADFARKLLIQLGFEQLLAIDQGTVLLDTNHPYDHEPHVDTDFVDAWLTPHDGPAAYVGSPVPEQEKVPVFDGAYMMPGGPGLGEPDVLEAAGLQTYTSYLQMENESQMHPTKQRILEQITATLEERFGAKIVVETAHHIRPMVNPEEESLERSVAELVDADVEVVVDAYTSHLHSDIMNECMKETYFRQALDDAGFEGPVLEAGPSGLTDAFAEGMADAVAAKVDAYPEDADLWLSLTHHGADPDLESQCRDRKDPYVNQSIAMFEGVERELENRSMAPNVSVHQVYGTGADDADDGFYSPTEAVENASAEGHEVLLDVPYELPGDGYDNLVNHRLDYDLDPRDAPHYDQDYRTHLTRENVRITITSSAFAADTRAQAQVDAIVDAMTPLFDDEEMTR
jgi:high-affinity iron transporter